MKLAVSFFLAIFIVTSCTKDFNRKYCWRLVDPQYNVYSEVCDKSEKQMNKDYEPCRFYRVGDEEFCWFIDSTIFIKDMPQDFIDRFMQCHPTLRNAVKVRCDYCHTWYTRQKNIYKPTGSFTYGSVRGQRLCGDTTLTLFHGREIILRETTDSLIKLQFSSNGTF